MTCKMSNVNVLTGEGRTVAQNTMKIRNGAERLPRFQPVRSRGPSSHIWPDCMGVSVVPGYKINTQSASKGRTLRCRDAHSNRVCDVTGDHGGTPARSAGSSQSLAMHAPSLGSSAPRDPTSGGPAKTRGRPSPGKGAWRFPSCLSRGGSLMVSLYIPCAHCFCLASQRQDHCWDLFAVQHSLFLWAPEDRLNLTKANFSFTKFSMHALRAGISTALPSPRPVTTLSEPTTIAFTNNCMAFMSAFSQRLWPRRMMSSR